MQQVDQLRNVQTRIIAFEHVCMNDGASTILGVKSAKIKWK